MADEAQMYTVTAPEGYTPEAGKPISFNLPASSFDFTKYAPKEIAEKPYFKDKIKSPDDLWKALDNSQTLLGKPRYGVPPQDAPDEVWAEFINGARAKEAKDYEFEEMPDAPAELKAPEDFKNAVKQLFYDSGTPPKMAKMLQKGFDKLTMGLFQKNLEKQKALDADFMKLVTPLVGEKPEEQTKNFAQSKKVLSYLLPKELHPFIEKADNTSLMLMTALTQVVQKKYLKEDELPADGGSGGSGGGSKEDLRKQAMEKTIQSNKLDSMDPKKKQLLDEATELYKKIASM